MSLRPIKKDSTDQSVVIRIIDSTTFLPENAVEHDTSGIDLWYRREGATKVSITEAALAALDSAHSDGGIELIGDGYYRLDLPDAAVATGVNGVMIGGTVTGMVVIGCYIPLVDYDPYDSVRAGLTALPNATADAAGGLAVSDAGGLDLDAMAADVAGLGGDAMRGTDSAALASVCTETRLAELDAANIPADIDAIPTTAMRGTDSAALASVCTETRLAELAAANLPADVDTVKAVADKLDDTLEDDSGTHRFTENALEQAPSGTGGDATAANQTTILTHLTDVKGTDFVKDTNSLVNVTGESPVNIDHESTLIVVE